MITEDLYVWKLTARAWPTVRKATPIPLVQNNHRARSPGDLYRWEEKEKASLTFVSGSWSRLERVLPQVCPPALGTQQLQTLTLAQFYSLPCWNHPIHLLAQVLVVAHWFVLEKSNLRSKTKQQDRNENGGFFFLFLAIATQENTKVGYGNGHSANRLSPGTNLPNF